MQEVILIIKPVSQEVSNMIKLTLERMKFDLVKSVSYKITEISFNFLFEQCKESMKIEDIRKIEEIMRKEGIRKKKKVGK